LLVRENQQQRILHFPVLDDTGELGAGLVDTVAVVRVDDEDQTLSAYEVLACWLEVLLTKVSGQGRGKQTQCGLRACSPTRDSALLSQHTREVVSPQGTDLVLASDIPDVELGVLVCDGLDVEADGGDGCDVLVELELVEDGCARVNNRSRRRHRAVLLVFPAASRPSISRRISLDPKILPIIFEIEAPMTAVMWFAKGTDRDWFARLCWSWARHGRCQAWTRCCAPDNGARKARRRRN
jgi:hypothetical protein